MKKQKAKKVQPPPPPSKPESEWIKVSMTHAEAQELTRIAESQRLSRSQLIGQILTDWKSLRQERKPLAAERQLGEVNL